MQTKTSQVRAALTQCDAWYASIGDDIRRLTERTEELWFQVDDLLDALQEAEERGNTAEAACHLQALLRCALAIHAEVQAARIKNKHQ